MIVITSFSDAYALSSSSAVTGYPDTNVQTYQPREIWRSTGTADQHIIFDNNGVAFWGNNMNTVAVLYHNGNAEQWRVRTSQTDPTVTSSITHDSGTMNMWSNQTIPTTLGRGRFGRVHSLYYQPSPAGGWGSRYTRVDFTTISSDRTGDGYFQAGRIMFGYAMDEYPGFGVQITENQDTTPIATRSGLFRRAGRRYREMQWSHPALTEAQTFGTFFNASNYGEVQEQGFDVPIVACVLHGSGAFTTIDYTTDTTLYGFITSNTDQIVTPVLNQTIQYYHVKTLTLQEMERP
jgi:hypothetical protein